MIPARYENAKFEDVPQEIRDRFEKMKETKRGLYIHGPVGTGKTHVLYAIERRLKEIREEREAQGIYRSLTCRVYNTTDFLRKIKNEFDHRDAGDLLGNTLEYRGLLMLDDVGSEKLTEWVQETFYLIVNNRYQEMVPFIITSNFSIRELADRVGDRTASRIVEMCDVVELMGDDKRMDDPQKIQVRV